MCLRQNAREGFDRGARSEFHGAGDGVESNRYLANERWILLWPMGFRSDDSGSFTVLKREKKKKKCIWRNRLEQKCTDTVAISTEIRCSLISLLMELHLLWVDSDSNTQ